MMNHLEKTFVKQVHNSTDRELLEAKKTYENWNSVSELWALNVIKRELASR